jgi:hypothetical protein
MGVVFLKRPINALQGAIIIDSLGKVEQSSSDRMEGLLLLPKETYRIWELKFSASPRFFPVFLI